MFLEELPELYWGLLATVNDPKLKDLANYLNLVLLFVWSTLKHYLVLIVNNPCNAEL